MEGVPYFPGGKQTNSAVLLFVAGTKVRLTGWSHFKLPVQARDAVLYFGVLRSDWSTKYLGQGHSDGRVWGILEPFPDAL